MEALRPFLPDLWLCIIAFILALYLITDGFDLGVGMLLLFHRDEERRSRLLSTIAPVWTSNQTWLVVLGGILFGAFPFFYGVVLSSLYAPLMLMLLGLIFRGVAFEFRGLAKRKRPFSLFLGIGSLVAVVAQGFTVGALLEGFPMSRGPFTGGGLGWLTPFSLLVAADAVSAYLLLGSAWLIAREEGPSREESRRRALPLAGVTFALSAAIYLRLLFSYPSMTGKLSTIPGLLTMAFFPCAAIVSLGLLLAGLRQRTLAPFIWSAALLLSGLAAVSVGLYPYMIPRGITVSEAAASPATLEFMLAVMALLIPAMLVYNIYLYRAFALRQPPGEADDYGGEHG